MERERTLPRSGARLTSERGLRVAVVTPYCDDRPTVHSRTSFRVHYEERGEAPPPGAKDNQHVRDALAWWRARSPEEVSQIRRRLGLSR